MKAPLPAFAALVHVSRRQPADAEVVDALKTRYNSPRDP